MTALTVLTASASAAATPAHQAASASDTIAIDSPIVWVEVIGGAGSNTLTVVDNGPRTPAGNLGTSQTHTIPVSPARRVIRIPPQAADASSLVTITNSAPTGVTIQAYRMSV